ALEFIIDHQKNQTKNLKVENTEFKSENRKLMLNNQNLIHKTQSLEENIALEHSKVCITCKKESVGIIQDSVKMYRKEEVTKVFLDLYKI
ncbi:2362_t:CDS:2, partial [Cetraspora pellucida]